MRYVLSPRAIEDFGEIREYLEREAGRAVALRVTSAIRRAASIIARYPGIGHSRTDLTDYPVKFHPVTPYTLIYDPNARPLLILRILHERRDIGAAIGTRGGPC